MATAVVSIICIALIVLGGMTMSQGISTSADTTALSVEEISVREGEIMRTGLTGVSTSLPASDNLLVTIGNSGQTKLASFSKWDFIAQYYDADDNYFVKWLPYNEGTLDDNEWQDTGIYLNGQPEAFEPNILNPEEQIALQAQLNPMVGYRAVNAVITTPNGVTVSIVCGPPLLTAHSETTTLASTGYYMLKGWTPADGTAMTETTDLIPRRTPGRWILHNQADTQDAKHLYPLTGLNEISAATWTVYYRGYADGYWWGGWRGEPSLNIDIIIRQADGSIRETIDTEAADAILDPYNSWVTVSATYDFPGYTVVDDTDYLEIDYYGTSSERGTSSWNAHILMRVDDNSLAPADQTRIDGLGWS